MRCCSIRSISLNGLVLVKVTDLRLEVSKEALDDAIVKAVPFVRHAPLYSVPLHKLNIDTCLVQFSLVGVHLCSFIWLLTGTFALLRSRGAKQAFFAPQPLDSPAERCKTQGFCTSGPRKRRPGWQRAPDCIPRRVLSCSPGPSATLGIDRYLGYRTVKQAPPRVKEVE